MGILGKIVLHQPENQRLLQTKSVGPRALKVNDEVEHVPTLTIV